MSQKEIIEDISNGDAAVEDLAVSNSYYFAAISKALLGILIELKKVKQ